MNAKVINWGIIGAGRIAEKFATDIQEVKNAQLIAIASRSASKAAGFASKFYIPKAYGSYESLVNDEQINAIYIATPHAFHYEHTKMALEHKKAVLCEKPLAMNSNEVQAMQDCAKRNSALLMEAMWTAFLPHYTYIKSVLDTKKFGEVQCLTADFGFYTPFNEASRVFDKAVGGGSLLDIGIYPIFLALNTLGEPTTVEAHAEYFKNGSDASCEILFKYGEKTAQLKSTLLENTKSEAIFECDYGTIKLHSRFHEPTTVTLIDHNNNKTQLDFRDNCLGYCYEIEHFNNLLRNNKTESPIMSFEESQRLIKYLDIVRSKIGLTY